ncbi:MAG: hypothetical protein QOD72_1545 [Acidimicrobiaceae bacterium]|nr:hypothetical protein [Acidimicrobiaceae bacterium]
MLLIFGIRVRWKTLAEGTFHCPSCGADRSFRRRLARRWFTLFFIPIVPLNVLGEFVECSSCHTRFKPAVLATPTSASIAVELATSMRAAVAAVVEAGDRANVAARLAAVGAMADIGTQEYVDATLTWDLERHASVGFDDRLRRIGVALEPVGREHLLTTLAGIAIADGEYSDDEQHVLERAGAALGLSPAYVRGVLDFARTARQ